MNENDENRNMDPDRAKVITKRIGQAFAFARDVIDNPELLDEIPDKSQLMFRDILFQGEHVRLIAHPSKERAGWWIARVSGPAVLARQSREWKPSAEAWGRAGKWGSPAPYPEGGPTAQQALDALAEKIDEHNRAAQAMGRA